VNLQPGTAFRYSDGNYIFEKLGKRKKITSRIFPSLIGKNKYESVGHALLERFGLLEKEEIHPFYSVRGEIAERFALEYLKDHYAKKGVEIITRTWNKEEVNYDNFPNNPDFGGLIDIAIASPEEYRTVIEVKSKGVRDYKKFKEANKVGRPDEELQGEFLAQLSGVGTYIMLYVFFDKEQEEIIVETLRDDFFKGYEPNTTVAATKIINAYQWKWSDLKYHLEEKIVRSNKVKERMAIAVTFMDEFAETKSIPESALSPDERIYLNAYYEHKTGTKIPQAVDRPF